MPKKRATPKKPPARRRDAVATREAIFDSARRAFVNAGYDHVGVREIARDAGVTAMLVNRYFGSKERLFAEVLAQRMATPSVLTPEVTNSADLGAELAAALIDQTKTGATPLDGFLIILRSASSERGAKVAREQIEGHHLKQVAAALSGNLAAERAALVLSFIAGFQMMRQMIGLSVLADIDRTTLLKLLAPVFQKLVDPVP